jgi:hypothetical protein
MMDLDPHGTWTFRSRNTADGATNTLLTLNPDGACQFYDSGILKLATAATGIAVTGTITAASVTLGIDDSFVGTLTLYGSDEDVGGKINLYNAADADGTSEYWYWQSEESGGSSQMVFGNNTAAFLEIFDATKIIEVQTGVTIDITSVASVLNVSSNNFKIDGFNVDAVADELNTKEFTVFLADISGANEVSFVSSVNGTVTQVYSSVTGDPGGNTIISGKIGADATAEFTATISISNGSGQHEVDSMSPADENVVTPGDAVIFASDAGAGNAVGIWLTVVITL